MRAFLAQAQPLAQPPNQTKSQGPNQAKMRSKSPFIFPEYQSDLSSDDKELVQGPSMSMSTEMSEEEELEPPKKQVRQELEVPAHVAQIQKMENQ